MDGILDRLPVLHRLALAYAPRQSRGATMALLALDARLADIVRSASEPVLAQIRLAWWRDVLGREAQERPQGEPLVAALLNWGDKASALVVLVDSWEGLVDAGPLGTGAMRNFCQGRAAAFAALAEVVDRVEASQAARSAGHGWALADLAARLDNPEERRAALELVKQHDWGRIALPRALRPLSVLYGLAAREVRNGMGSGSPSAANFIYAVRIGLFGR